MGLRFWKVYRAICRRGYKALGQIRDDATDLKDNPWMSHSGFPPSYAGGGRYRMLATLEAAKKVDADSILEIAGGGGFLSACLVNEKNRVVLNDLRKLEHELAYWKNGDKVEFLGGDCFKLKPKEQFDLVIACEVIEHIAHGDEFLKKLFEFVKPGGRLLVTTPNGTNWRSKLPTFDDLSEKERVAMEPHQFKPDADGHLYLYKGAEMKRLLGEAGFCQIEARTLISPWISGESGFRFLPQWDLFLPLYGLLETLTLKLPALISERITNQLIVTATKPESSTLSKAA